VILTFIRGAGSIRSFTIYGSLLCRALG